MNNKLAALLFVPLVLLTLCSHGETAVEWDIAKTLKIGKTPLDVAVSVNGRWVYVLTEQGSIVIYSGEGKLEDEVAVGKQIDGIKAGPEEHILYLSSRKNKTVQILVLDFIQNINISNSPFKGRIDAPVQIVVFSDFQ